MRAKFFIDQYVDIFRDYAETLTEKRRYTYARAR